MLNFGGKLTCFCLLNLNQEMDPMYYITIKNYGIKIKNYNPIFCRDDDIAKYTICIL